MRRNYGDDLMVLTALAFGASLTVWLVATLAVRLWGVM